MVNRLYRLTEARHWHGNLQPGISRTARWHSAGRKVVYLAETPATALLEWLKGQFSSKLLPQELVSIQLFLIEFQCNLDDAGIQTANISTLPHEWWRIPNNRSVSTQAIGNSWLDAREYLAMRVPSTALPSALASIPGAGTTNLLLNPGHADFADLIAHGSCIKHPFNLTHYLGFNHD